VESFPQRDRRFLYEFSTNPHDSFVSWGLFERTWCKLLGQNCPVLMNPGYDAQNHKGNPRFDEFMKQVPPPWRSTGLRTVGTMCESQRTLKNHGFEVGPSAISGRESLRMYNVILLSPPRTPHILLFNIAPTKYFFMNSTDQKGHKI